jgi:transcriptional regulator with XRE-family HTH domain
MRNMLSHINSTAKTIWNKMRNKEYRDSFVSSHISNSISAQIHAMRKAREWTQGELASRCNMQQSRISSLEDPDFENVEIATLQRLASAFDVALSVRFVPFSEIARRASSLTSSDFVVRDYSVDSLDYQRESLPQMLHTIVVPPSSNINRKDFKITPSTSKAVTWELLPQRLGTNIGVPVMWN